MMRECVSRLAGNHDSRFTHHSSPTFEFTLGNGLSFPNGTRQKNGARAPTGTSPERQYRSRLPRELDDSVAAHTGERSFPSGCGTMRTGSTAALLKWHRYT